MPEIAAGQGGGGLTSRIHAVYATLPERERRVAEILLERPADLGFLTASELAAEAGVSNATVSRVVRRLGYDSFEAARRTVRAARLQGSPLYLGGGQGDRPLRISDALAAETRALETTLSRVGPTLLHDVARAIATADGVRTLGFRNSRFVADYAAAALSQLRPAVTPLLAGGQTRGESLAGIGSGDLVIAVGLRRRPRGFKDLVSVVSGRGAQVLLIADNSIRETPALARWHLDCVVESPQFADTYVGAMALVRMLMLEVAEVLGEAGRRHLAEIEALHEALNELE